MGSGGLILGLALETSVDPEYIGWQAREADRLGLGFVLFDDEPGQPAGTDQRWSLDPIETASFAAALTNQVGLVATAAATHAEPYHLSNRFSSLDWGSSGRAGWLMTVDASAERARAYSASVPDPGTARAEADAVLDATRRLWDSWEDGALIAESASGRFLDRDKLHYVDAGGDLFSIRGPALMPRPVQGQVVVMARATDRVAGADVTLLREVSEDQLVATADTARELGAPRTFVEINVETVDDSRSDLDEMLRRLVHLVDGVVLRATKTEEVLDHFRTGALIGLFDDGTLEAPKLGQTLRQRLGLRRLPSRYATDFTEEDREQPL